MNRKEYMDELKKELKKLPAEEAEAAIEYYEEYFDEAGTENEDKVIEELGSPKKIAGQIKSEYAVRLFDEDEKPTAKKGLSAIWYVIIGICSAPVAVPLSIFLGVMAIAIFAVVIALIASAFVCAIGCIAGAVAAIVMGIMMIPTAAASAVMFIGFGLAALGIMAAAMVLLFLGIRAATRAIVKAARKRNDRKNIEKMAKTNELKKWRYKEDEQDE